MLSSSSLCAGCGARVRCSVRVAGHADAAECLPQGRGPFAGAAPPARASAAAGTARPFHSFPQGAPALLYHAAHSDASCPPPFVVLRPACALSVQLGRCHLLEESHACHTPDCAVVSLLRHQRGGPLILSVKCTVCVSTSHIMPRSTPLLQAAKRYRQLMRKAALYTAGGTLIGLAIFGSYR